MNRLEIYTKNWCPFCHAAKRLLKEKRIAFTEYDVTDDSALERKMQTRSGRTSVPQIFIDDKHIGGYDDLAEQWAAGVLPIAEASRFL
ncbi:MAG: glutaredoxin 3 [Pseudomonadota bacterium]